MDYERMSEVDVAYHILAQKKVPVHYKELIQEVIEAKHKPVQSLAMAISEIYTMLNNGQPAFTMRERANGG